MIVVRFGSIRARIVAKRVDAVVIAVAERASFVGSSFLGGRFFILLVSCFA